MICLIDDNEHVRKALCFMLGVYDFEVVAYSSPLALLALSDIPAYDCFVLDLHMPGMSGLELLTVLRERKIMTPTIMLTGSEDLQRSARIQTLGVAAILTKPINSDVFINAINAAIKHPS